MHVTGAWAADASQRRLRNQGAMLHLSSVTSQELPEAQHGAPEQ